MPTYDYRCEACEHTLELFQKITESPKKKCPACKKSRLKRLIGGGAGFLFKGSGFYLTDYGRNAHRTQGDAPLKPSGDSESKADAKPTPKADTGTAPASSTGGEAKAAPAPKSEPKASGSGPATP